MARGVVRMRCCEGGRLYHRADLRHIGEAELTQPSEHTRLRAPSRLLMLLEQRVLLEAGALIAAAPLMSLDGRGDNSPVLVIPGFTASDTSTATLRFFLRTWGYWAHGWRVGSNLGPTAKTLAAVSERLQSVFDRHGRRVTVIGHSAGGTYARYLARQMPDMVRQVITLGCPIQIVSGDRSAASALSRHFEHEFDPELLSIADHQRGVLPVPATSIYTRTDGVVRWQVCLDVVDNRHENVEVLATHSGMAVNPAVLHVIADRLRQREGEWRPFRPPPLTERFYPPPAAWDAERSHRAR
jgi:pimeloyl-ACP methyl ester carboxylesterase